MGTDTRLSSLDPRELMKRRIVAAFLTAHAIAHLAGFAWPWWLLEPDPYATPAPNGPMFSSATAMQVMSSLWLAVAAAFVVAALAVLGRHWAWRRVTAGAAIASLVLSLLSWPGSLLGIPINAAILMGLRRARRAPWRIARA
jgi:hypothetical protein